MHNRVSSRIPALALIATALVAVSPLRAAWPVAEGAEVFLTADASVEHNDNIFLSSAGTRSDTILDLSPGILLTFGENAINTGEIGLKERFRFYTDNSGLNEELADIWGKVTRNDGKTTVRGDIRFTQLDQASIDARGAGFLVRRDIFHAGLDSDVNITEKSVVSAGIIYDNTEYKRAGYVDWKWWEIPVRYYYKTFPKLELGAGITYRTNELSTALADSTELFYNVRARGEITPKLNGEVAVGLRSRDADFGGDEDLFGIQSQLTFAATEKTLIMLALNNDFSHSGTGASYQKLSFNAGTDISFTPAFRAGANVSYGNYDYTTGQDDDFWTGDIHANYLINAFISLNAAYNYAKNDSSLIGGGFTQNRWVLGASLKY